MPVADLQSRISARGTRAFKSFVRQSDDRRLERTVGSPMGLRVLFGQFAERMPEFAVRFAGELQCELARTDGTLRVWTLDTRSGRAVARRGRAERPALTARLTIADFVRIAAGELDPGAALLDGRLDFAGDFSVAAQISAIFGALGGR